ncbi:hypothetical protein HNP33_003095 [Comamonas odontotermitis]|uniref:Uncharacterized protein n=1 Tax=Comamonas odontotermitis TaxID=379895 RepID=A0ABR6RIJ2_9BURK|nr:hypothetical protein [Comamonas odontotermitis]MBB6578990.1 hypothetical protein [Comamonas odontotermitis]
MNKEKISSLAERLLQAKAAEDAATKDRRTIEAELVQEVGVEKANGSKTTAFDAFKVTITTAQNVKLDWDKFDEMAGEIPAEFHPVKKKREVDEKGVNWLRENKPDIYAKLPLTITDRTPTAKVERV